MNAEIDPEIKEPAGDRVVNATAQEAPRKNPRRDMNGAKVADPIADLSKPLQLVIPDSIPGASAPEIVLPKSNEVDHRASDAAYDLQFPLPATMPSLPNLTTPPVTLEELEELALQNSPHIVQAAAGITMSQGTAIQSGVYPNPVLGYEADTVGSSYTRNYQGISASQLVKTAGKLRLQTAIANMELMNSQLAYQRTRLEIRRQVRAGYYNVLVAQEANRINEALVSFMNDVFKIMLERTKGGFQATYEQAQLRSLVNQARMGLIASQNRYTSAWKQLAAATGIPDLPPAPLVDRVDLPVPNLDFDALLNRALNVHPDIEASRNFEAQSKLNLQLQRRIPIPDFTVAGVFQKDFTVPGFDRTSYNLNVSAPLPLFDKNLGNILNAEGKLRLSAQQLAVTRNQMTGNLADAFERYQTGRTQAEYFRNKVLPDLVRAYHGVYQAHIINSAKVGFSDIVVAQQNLANGIALYISALQQQWVAAADIANLTQLENFQDLLTLPVVGTEAANGDVPQSPSTEGTKP